MDGADAVRRHARHWAETWQAAWEALDVEAVVALYAPEATFSSQPFRDVRHGQRGVRAYVAEAFRDESEVHARFGEPLVDDACAAVTWWATLRDGGEEMTLAGTSVLRFDSEGRVVEQRDTWNQASSREAPPRGWRDPGGP